MTSLTSLLFSSALALFLAASFSDAATTAPSPSSTPNPSPVSSPSALNTNAGISIEASQKVEFPVNEEEKKKLLKEYKKAFSEEEKAFDHQERSAMKEFSAVQSAKVRTWNAQEKSARHSFFKSTTKGPERRKYIQDYIARKKSFDQSVKDENQVMKSSWKQKRELLKQNQKDRDVQFKASLDQNKRPPAALWPSGH